MAWLGFQDCVRKERSVLHTSEEMYGFVHQTDFYIPISLSHYGLSTGSKSAQDRAGLPAEALLHNTKGSDDPVAGASASRCSDWLRQRPAISSVACGKYRGSRVFRLPARQILLELTCSALQTI